MKFISFFLFLLLIHQLEAQNLSSNHWVPIDETTEPIVYEKRTENGAFGSSTESGFTHLGTEETSYSKANFDGQIIYVSDDENLSALEPMDGLSPLNVGNLEKEEEKLQEGDLSQVTLMPVVFEEEESFAPTEDFSNVEYITLDEEDGFDLEKEEFLSAYVDSEIFIPEVAMEEEFAFEDY